MSRFHRSKFVCGYQTLGCLGSTSGNYCKWSEQPFSDGTTQRIILARICKRYCSLDLSWLMHYMSPIISSRSLYDMTFISQRPEYNHTVDGNRVLTRVKNLKWNPLWELWLALIYHVDASMSRIYHSLLRRSRSYSLTEHSPALVRLDSMLCTAWCRIWRRVLGCRCSHARRYLHERDQRRNAPSACWLPKDALRALWMRQGITIWALGSGRGSEDYERSSRLVTGLALSMFWGETNVYKMTALINWSKS